MTREQLRQQGEATRTSLFGAGVHEPAGFGTLLTEAVHGAVWNRPGLGRARPHAVHARRTRCLAAVAPASSSYRRRAGTRPVAGSNSRGAGAGRSVRRIFRSRGDAGAGGRGVRGTWRGVSARSASRCIAGGTHQPRARADAAGARRAQRAGLCRAGQPGDLRAVRTGDPVRLWRDLVPSRAGASLSARWSRWRRSPRCGCPNRHAASARRH